MTPGWWVETVVVCAIGYSFGGFVGAMAAFVARNLLNLVLVTLLER
jgi:hypothetical protein